MNHVEVQGIKLPDLEVQGTNYKAQTHGL